MSGSTATMKWRSKTKAIQKEIEKALGKPLEIAAS